MSTHRVPALVVAAVLLAGCDATEPTEPLLSQPRLAASLTEAPSLTDVPGVTEVVGEAGGSDFALFKPAGWEDGARELMVYAHGYVQPFLEPTLPTEMDWFRDWLLSQGIAVAYSSYSQTGYAVRDGAVRTHQLNGLFSEQFGEPAVTYLTGVSMGAMIASLLQERHTPQYDGALFLCGVLAGGLENAEYIAHVRVLWDAFFPGTLEGSLYDSPPGYVVVPGSSAYETIVGTVLAHPERAATLAGMDPVNMPINTADLSELVTAFVKVLGYQINGGNALSQQLHGHSFFDNSGIQYSGSDDDEEINATVVRYTADPDAAGYLERWYTPTGMIGNPVVTIHTTRDPLVPDRGEDEYADRVAAAGNTQLLTRLPPTDAFGHCAFQGPEVVEGFLTLRAAVRGR